MSTRKNRFYEEVLYKVYCENPRPLWNNIFTTIVMVFTGITAATFEVSEDYRIPKIALWLLIGICSIIHQGCIWPKLLWISRLDSLATLALQTLYVITFYETAPWWVWTLAVVTVIVFIYYYYRFYQNPPISMIQYIRLVNLWHIGVTATTIALYATAGLSPESPEK